MEARLLERFSLDCRIGIGFGFGFGFTTSFGWLVYLLWFWFYDSQVKTALMYTVVNGLHLPVLLYEEVACD